MSRPLYPPSRPQSLGETLDSAFRIFQVSLFKCLPLGMLALLAGQLGSIYRLSTGRLPGFGGDPLWWGFYLSGILLTLIITCALILRQHAVVTGRPTVLREELAAAMTRLPAILVLVILGLLAVAAGLVALILPGIYLLIALSCAWPVLVLEKQSPWQALLASIKLIKGHWWRTTLVFTVAFIIVVVFYALGGALAAIVLSIVGSEDLAVVTAVWTVIAIGLIAVVAPFSSAVLLAVYADLRVRKG